MKHKALTINEVLTARNYTIIAAPCWAYAKPGAAGVRKPIAELWKPLLVKLRRKAAEQFARGWPTTIGG